MSVERGKRYFKYTVCATFDETDVPIRVNLPPLSEIGFSQHYKECLVKVRTLYANSNTLLKRDEICWAGGAVGAELEIEVPGGGIVMLTTIPTRQQGYLSTLTNIIEERQVAPTRQTFGVGPIFKQQHHLPNNPDSVSSWYYEDTSDIERSGVLCSVPFGSEFRIVFNETNVTSTQPDNLFIATEGVGPPQVAAGQVAIEFEFLLI